ncbi:MAG TPA: CoA-binding protein [Anaerolineae bacterium]|nr:CoA-binding protein [Anaerolineae bacterium]
MDTTDLIPDFIGRQRWAIVGVSQDPAKYGARIYRALRDAGYIIFAVNPKGGELDGMPVYRSLADLPELPEVVDLVVPPSVTEEVIRVAHKLGLRRIWMQPGSESDLAIAYCRENGMQVVFGACAMVHRGHWD